MVKNLSKLGLRSKFSFFKVKYGFLVIQVKMFCFWFKNYQNLILMSKFSFFKVKMFFFGYSGQNFRFFGLKILSKFCF